MAKWNPHVRVIIAFLLAVWLLPSCKTTPPKPDKPLSPEGHIQFRPATFVSMLHKGEGPYMDAYSANSYAVWVSPEVSAAKEQADTAAGMPVDPALQQDVASLNRQFLIVELHLESVFGDMGVAYDIVRLRNVDIRLETVDGKKISPIQSLPAAPVEETPQEALRRYNQTHTLLFPMQDVWLGVPTVSRETPAVRIVLIAANTEYFFEWPAATDLEPIPFQIRREDVEYVTRLGYHELYTGLRRVAHIFD
ncbi:MAG: hypothetical protein AMXMBFR84_11960 [Candidatus Hydrogenedentota bacterium]